jgi:hypothetical protein
MRIGVILKITQRVKRKRLFGVVANTLRSKIANWRAVYAKNWALS